MDQIQALLADSQEGETIPDDGTRMSPEEFMDVWSRMSPEQRQAAGVFAIGAVTSIMVQASGVPASVIPDDAFNKVLEDLNPKTALFETMSQPGMPFSTQQIAQESDSAQDDGSVQETCTTVSIQR